MQVIIGEKHQLFAWSFAFKLCIMYLVFLCNFVAFLRVVKGEYEVKKINKVRLIFAIIMILSGAAVFSYPFIGNYLHTRNASVAVADYEKQVEAMEKEDIDALKKAAEDYNKQLNSVQDLNASGDSSGDGSGNGADVTSDSAAGDKYLDYVTAGSAIGYITIPKIDLNLPIYEGTSDSVLEKGIGHIRETSYPVGGPSTHAALSGHRGMADAELFTNLDKLEIGNQFYLHVLDDILAYEVDQIRVVEPDDISDLSVVYGEDMCTLVTCTPKGINSHRLLVRGHRVPYNGEDDGSHSLYQSVHTGTAIERWLEVWPWLFIAAVIVVGIEFMLLNAILGSMRRRSEDD